MDLRWFAWFVFWTCCAATPVVVRFENSGSESLELFWLDTYTRKPRLETAAPPEFVYLMNSFEGHTFRVSSNGRESTDATVTGDGSLSCTTNDTHVLCDGRYRKHVVYEPTEADLETLREACRTDLTDHPEDAEHFCARRFDNRLFFTHKLQFREEVFQRMYTPNVQRRELYNRIQPPSLRNFTQTGFEIMDIPRQLQRSLADFWLQERLRASRPENHPPEDPNLSGRLCDTWMLQLPAQLLASVSTTVRPLLAKWANVDFDGLRRTAFYGIRLYRNGSTLHRHVDRRDTHALSVIFEVGSLGFDGHVRSAAEWPLEIRDHSGTVHSVPNRPGQMIFYESATCEHGRPTPFPGREAANFFIHFAPRGWPEAYEAASRQEL